MKHSAMKGQLVILSCLLGLAWSKKPVTTKTQAMNYLKYFQYMGPKTPMEGMKDLDDEVAFPEALRYFQRKMGMKITGVFDDDTQEMMSKDRCGVPDMMNKADGMKRRKRYALNGYKWSANNLSYKFINFSPDLSDDTIDKVISMAFKMWSDVTPLTFTKITGTQVADMDISFGVGEHGDNIPFDGPGGVLAHAFFPQFGGDAHFDDDETFTDLSTTGVNLLFVAVHEIGHSLGLEHSEVAEAIMFPTYSGFVTNLKLHADDIAGIQALYGAPTTQAERTTTPQLPVTTTRIFPTTAPASRPDFCTNSNVDAIYEMFNDIYVFQGEWYVKVNARTGILPGYPRLITDTFSGLPGNLDAAVDTIFGDVYFLKGTNLWIYKYDFVNDAYTLDDSGSPSKLGLPSNIDMIYRWTGNGRIYATKGDQYYRLSFLENNLARGYPRDIAEWGLPNVGSSYTDAAVIGTRTFFFAGDKYIRYNDINLEADPGYPKSVAEMWFKCEPDMDMEMDTDQNQIPGVDNKNPVSGSDPIKITFVYIMVVFVLSQLMTM